MVRGVSFLFAAALSSFGAILNLSAQQQFSIEELQQLASKGSGYRNKIEYLHGELNSNRVQLASAWAADGISKYVTFFSDKDVVCSLVAEGNANLHTVTVEELEAIPKTGLLFANVELHARGAVPIYKLNKRYTDGKAKLVLQINGSYVEPVKDGYFPSAPKTGCTQTFYLWSMFGTYRFGFGAITPLTISCDPVGPSKFSLEFGFQLSEVQMQQTATVILLDGARHQHRSRIDLSELRK